MYIYKLEGPNYLRYEIDKKVAEKELANLNYHYDLWLVEEKERKEKNKKIIEEVKQNWEQFWIDFDKIRTWIPAKDVEKCREFEKECKKKGMLLYEKDHPDYIPETSKPERYSLDVIPIGVNLEEDDGWYERDIYG